MWCRGLMCRGEGEMGVDGVMRSVHVCDGERGEGRELEGRRLVDQVNGGLWRLRLAGRLGGRLPHFGIH